MLNFNVQGLSNLTYTYRSGAIMLLGTGQRIAHKSVANIGGRTKSAFQFDADPNKLMQQFTKSGNLELLQQTKKIALHGDFSAVPDFFTALLQVQQAEEEFMAMPSRIRNHVDNQVSEFIELISDPDRNQECLDLGLFSQDQPTFDIPTPQPAPAVPAPAEPPTEGETPA